ncbi:glycoside hydrolase family 9 protein [Asticcacaulis sp. SL142]|uniref:glycoside hydrolase family 9 protein n=1 Tax=Asticcacaulis sp. SL142 TaxID=2995155 RepID=UPI00226C9C14|nr:glycoside hydrolase family 9 protein [Asticcacaulis sp. SL142]WAC46844.1 glycoside hydrolase family 9 protein [Asticcacaulis sp. SL142]
MTTLSNSNRRRFLLAAGASLVPLSLISCGGGGGGGGSSGGGSSSSSSSSSSIAPVVQPTTMTNGIPIVVDQFGYLPGQAKIAVVRDPQSDNLGTTSQGDPIVSFDAADSFAPGTVYDVVNAATNAVVFTGGLTAWNGGATDPSSGDKAWHFDFSSVTTPGEYFIRDTQRNVKSYTFKIAADVYLPVLKAAVRTFYYQRAGQVKLATHAGANWADGASHVGPGQDRNARLFTAQADPSTERDLSGGWYDAGDANKYTSWAAGYVTALLYAYFENPTVWGDDYNIPESGNGIPDIIDEARWGLDWLKKMQDGAGGDAVLSIVGLGGGSPPSSITTPSYYGPASTSATLSTAGALALGAKILAGFPALSTYAADLRIRAERAWTWAVANPNVLFQNNDAAYGSQGLGAGQQETDDRGRLMAKLQAAIYLYALTGSSVYRDFVDANYDEANLVRYGNYVTAYETGMQDALLYYASLPGATTTVANSIRAHYVNGANGEYVWGKITTKADPYYAFIFDYIWGSNSVKANTGLIFTTLNTHNLGTAHTATENLNAAAHYIHYLHGVNPLGLCYLTNMSSLGAEKSANEIWHFWFFDGTPWDSAATSAYGPPPGFLPGGPNKGQWNWGDRCPSISSQCGTTRPSPPYGQPGQKSYKDFNTAWPLNSWPITENSNGYQVAYIRLLSRFV